MDKIRETFEEWRLSIYGESFGGTNYDYSAMRISFRAGHDSRDEEIRDLQVEIEKLYKSVARWD